MEFRQLRYFIAVAEEGNIGAAAKRLHISQPPITRQMQALEHSLGVTLFQRTHRGVTLTAAGTSFLADAKRLIDLARVSGARSQAVARGELGELKVAYFGTAIYKCLPQLLKTFLSNTPTATVSLTQMSKEAQIDGLFTGAIDIGFSRFYSPREGMTIRHVGEERLFLALEKSRLGTLPKQCTLQDLHNVPLILFPRGGRPSFADNVIGLFKRAGIEPTIVTEVEDVTAALALTAAGVGATIVPASLAETLWPDVAFIKLNGVNLTVPVSCIYRSENPAPIVLTILNLLPDLNPGKKLKKSRNA
jgi:DNA-binding transcriptional LysR family regulator